MDGGSEGHHINGTASTAMDSEAEGKIRILVANDDGIEAPGIIALLKQLVAQKGRFDLRVVAPAEEKSGQSHSITIHAPLVAEKYYYQEADLSNLSAYKVHGTPVDCVKLALHILKGWTPHVVLSGINKGNNAGMNVIYSGTVAAAAEGSLQGFKSVALSLDHPVTYPSVDDVWPYDVAAELSMPLIEQVIQHDLPFGVVINLNFPNVLSTEEVQGTKITQQGLSTFKEGYKLVSESQGEKMTFKVKGAMNVVDTEDHLDTYALRKGWVTVTPIGCFRDRFDSSAWVADELTKWSIFHPPKTARL